jgi:polyisoprenoid-binding protein YceI
MLKKIVACFFLSTPFFMIAQEWKQDTSKTKVVFEIRNLGLNVDGNFNEVKINTNLTSNQLQESYINAVIVVKSISTGIESRDEHILKEDYFDEKKYQKIVLKSTKIKKNEANETLLFAEL